jgi:kinesin family protein 25
MAYGQTGSGKTHTMVGSHDNDLYNVNLDPHPEEGIIPRAVRELFRWALSVTLQSSPIAFLPFSLIQDKPPGMHSVEISVLEIYNNEIRDLLAPEVATFGPPNSPLAQRRLKPKPAAKKPAVRPKSAPPIQKCDVKMSSDGSMCVSSLTSR